MENTSKQIWKIENNTLVWKVQNGQTHSDDLEMSGLYADYIVSYGVNEDGTLALSKSCFFPTLRTFPNNTHSTLTVDLKAEDCPKLLKDGNAVAEYPRIFRLDGTLTAESETKDGFSVTRQFYPASNCCCCIETVTVRADDAVTLSLTLPNAHVHGYIRGTKGVYVIEITHNAPDVISLDMGETMTYSVCYAARIANQPSVQVNAEEELTKRYERVRMLCDGSLKLSTGNEELDVMTRFAKLRAGESIFETLTGKYHSPGGRAYYAATWCNDQVEYAGPHFAMTGDKTAIEASLNAYRSYTAFMSDTYHRIPSSIIAEGLDIWEGAGDRGDAAMYLYGASLFCLYLGDEAVARELYGAIMWCAEYCERQKVFCGVIGSQADELEGRFPTDGIANLSTSCLCYGGLLFAAKLADSLGDVETAVLYRKRAKALEAAIEEHFGANLHGYETYRYSEGFDTLRAWICLPLCMGIGTRSEQTLEAMLSPYLWTEEGMLTCEFSEENRSRTIWDRSTLYGMKAAFLAGAGKRMVAPLLRYCHKRLVCDRVPYAVEAYPEGGKRHLSAESALFVRVVTEGIFGIMPESLTSFSFVPSLPEAFPKLRLSDIRICGGCFDIRIGKDEWVVCDGGIEVARGKTDGKRVVVRRGAHCASVE